MKLQFIGAAHEVTGSCTLLTVGDKKIIIDCGLEQGFDLYENCELPISANDIDFVLLTHAHIDHSGKIPALVANGFDGAIYSTFATEKLCEIMLMDSAHIQSFEAEWRNRKAKRSGKEEYVPLYTAEDVLATMKKFVGCSYNKDIKLCDSISIKFIDSGHLLGSASIEITATENGVQKVIVFSGDIGNISRPLINDPVKPKEADMVIVESTYGNRTHGDRPDYLSQLTRIVQETLDRGGNVIIPCFAIGRTQEMLYLLREIKEKNLIHGHDGFPVWVDSPLAVQSTEIYSNSLREFYDKETLALLNNGVNPIKFDDLRFSITSEDSKALNLDKTPSVILSSSGMCEAGRIRHHLKHNLWRSESTILFVGYQSESSLGGAIIRGADKVKLFGEEVTVAAHIEQLDGISGHADCNMLFDWVKSFERKPTTVFVNHGDDTVCDEFAENIKINLGITSFAPYNGAVYDIISGECLEIGNKNRKERSNAFQNSGSPAFIRLVTAGNKLLSVIQKYKGASNKEIAKFADQILALCDKWKRN